MEVDIQCAEGRAGPWQAGLQGDWGRSYQVGEWEASEKQARSAKRNFALSEECGAIKKIFS